MRFEKIHLHAFGPFTDVNLSFPQGRADLHIIYGRNEAGKSSLLRAFRDLLFGILSRSGDGFLHEFSKLKLEAEIRNHAGQRLRFLRRKGNARTLIAENGVPLPDDALRPFLGGVSRDYFSAMFGMGSAELRAGAEDLLGGEGDLGNALFSASHGGTPVRDVIGQLEKDAESLFRGRATKDVLIRNGAAQLKELLKKSKEAVVSVDEWEAVQTQLGAAQLKRDTLVKARAECVEKLDWLQRCEDTLPSVGQLREALNERETLGKLPDVAHDFALRATEALKTLEDAAKAPENLAGRMSDLSRKLSECRVDDPLITDGPELKALYEELAGYRVKQESLVGFQLRSNALHSKLMEGMKLMRLPGDFSSLESLRIGEAQLTAYAAAARNIQKTAQELSLHRDEIRNFEEDINANEEKLNELPDADLNSLRDVLADAAEATEAANTLAAARGHSESLHRTAQGTRALIPGAPKALDLNALAALELPLPASIRSFQEKFAAADRRAAEKRIFVEKQQQEIQSHRDALQALDRFGDLPSEESLQCARQFRDRGWKMVLEEWQGKGARCAFVEGIPLEQAFPQSIVRADEIADRLRKEASVVAEAQEKSRQIKACEDRIQNALLELQESENTAAEDQKAWHALWAPFGIKTGTPTQMQEWRDGWLSLRNAVTKLDDATQLLAEKEKKVAQAREKLAEVLGDSSEKSFELLFRTAKRKVQEGEQAQGERKQIQTNIRDQQSKWRLKSEKTERLEQEAARAASEWKQHAKQMGIAHSTAPETALSLLQERRDLLSLFDQWTSSTGEATLLKDGLGKYAGQVHEYALKYKVTAPETQAQVGQLWKIFSANEEAWKERERIKKEISKLETELKESQLKMRQAGRDVENILQEAGIHEVAQLRPLVSLLEHQSRINADLRRIRGIIAGLARNEEIEAFVARVGEEAAEIFPQRRESLQLEKTECDRQLTELGSEIHKLNDQRDTMEKAEDQAAELKQQAEMQAASLREHASRYIRLQLALDVLRKQVDKFREQNQGPLLEKSGAAFRHMTQGAFTSLAADFNEKDTPVLVGCRVNGSRVPIDGMSEGTRDQLYLALRFAALDLHLQTHEPMPLILDDLLMTFDNERAKAVLPELAKMAGRSQVFLFTHHEHLIELSREALGPENYVLHRLGSS